MLVGVEPETEDPVCPQVCRHLEGEANSDNDAVSQDERDGQVFRRRGLSGHEGVKIARGGESFRGQDQSQSSKTQENLEMAIVAQERFGYEVIASALRSVAQNRFVKWS